jgi:hypothetical protein
MQALAQQYQGYREAIMHLFPELCMERRKFAGKKKERKTYLGIKRE